MTEHLMISLHCIALTLNIQKLMILRYHLPMDESNLNFEEIGDGLVKVLNAEESHRYVERFLSVSASSRSNSEFRNLIRAAWTAFRKHKSVLLELQI